MLAIPLSIWREHWNCFEVPATSSEVRKPSYLDSRPTVSFFPVALSSVYRLCNRLHRDLSSTNIILFADPKFKYGDTRSILMFFFRDREDGTLLEAGGGKVANFACRRDYQPGVKYFSLPKGCEL